MIMYHALNPLKLFSAHFPLKMNQIALEQLFSRFEKAINSELMQKSNTTLDEFLRKNNMLFY